MDRERIPVPFPEATEPVHLSECFMQDRLLKQSCSGTPAASSLYPSCLMFLVGCRGTFAYVPSAFVFVKFCEHIKCDIAVGGCGGSARSKR